MFTGIIEELGTVRSVSRTDGGVRISVAAATVLEGVRVGDSVAVNGVCLTVIEDEGTGFAADVSPETLARTTLETLEPGSPVNLERAMLPTTRFGGHIVQGHVDSRGTFVSAETEGDFRLVRIRFSSELGRYFVEKGSVAVEGISLTIAALDNGHFDIAVIPKTWETTNLSSLTAGDAVNLEVDIIAKYVERMLAAQPSN